LSLVNEEDDVIKEIMKQKNQNKTKVEVDIRKTAREENKQKDKKLSTLEKFNKLKEKKNDDDIEIDDEKIFKIAVDLSNASSVAGMNLKFPPVQNKKASVDASVKKREQFPLNPPSSDIQKAKSESIPEVKPKEVEKHPSNSEEIMSPPVENSSKPKIEEEKTPPPPKEKTTPGNRPRGGLMFANSRAIKATANGSNNGVEMNKDKSLGVSKSPNLVSDKSKVNKPIIMSKKPIQLKQGGLKNKNMNIYGMDSEEENDYPFDDGIKCVVF
jgi:hypothetical protein